MNDLAARLVAEVERLAEAASPEPLTLFRNDSANLVPWELRYPNNHTAACFFDDPDSGRCECEATAKLQAAFGSPDRAMAIMSVLVLNARTPCLLNECGQCAQCISRALIRDLAAALSVEEESDGS